MLHTVWKPTMKSVHLQRYKIKKKIQTFSIHTHVQHLKQSPFKKVLHFYVTKLGCRSVEVEKSSLWFQFLVLQYDDASTKRFGDGGHWT